MTANEILHGVAALLLGFVPFVAGYWIRGVDHNAMPFAYTFGALLFVVAGSWAIALRWAAIYFGQCGGCRRVKVKVNPWS